MKNLSPLSPTEITAALALLPEWHYDASTKRIHARWRFTDYAQVCSFVMYVSLLAQQHDHHPDNRFGWGYAEIFLTTHDAKGVTQRDITLAKDINNYPAFPKN